MFTAGLVWDNIYANVDAIDEEKKRRVHQAVNAALHDLSTRYVWPGYYAQFDLATLADGSFYLPSDVARRSHFEVLSPAGDTFLGNPQEVTNDMNREDRYNLLKYRLVAQGDVTRGLVNTRSAYTFDLADGVADLPANVTADIELSLVIATHGAWIRLSGESAPRQVYDTGDGLALCNTYYGPARPGRTVTINPGRRRYQLYVPGSTDASDTPEGTIVRVHYTQFPEDVTHEQFLINLPNVECLEAAATARLMRQMRRREDADRWKADAKMALIEAMDSAMDYMVEHSGTPEGYDGTPLSFGKSSTVDTITPSPLN